MTKRRFIFQANKLPHMGDLHKAVTDLDHFRISAYHFPWLAICIPVATHKTLTPIIEQCTARNKMVPCRADEPFWRKIVVRSSSDPTPSPRRRPWLLMSPILFYLRGFLIKNGVDKLTASFLRAKKSPFRGPVPYLGSTGTHARSVHPPPGHFTQARLRLRMSLQAQPDWS
jgi:hypothetical protein